MAEKRDIATARSLRQRSTDAEMRLWMRLRLRGRQIDGAKFRRQVPTAGYIADFACASARLVIELDGGQHAVLRFWNHDVLANTDGVLEEIRRAILNARP